uniref:uncharacterized protein LOC122601206 n=1 Tax=Erigeron canadensis TaxID=72917 RepID=UPI001CB89882|nr:uncharacterized protein LOC122601206 [Erigeron canadensis]
MVSDNGKQFAENPFKTWCQDMDIQQRLTSVAHPQGNDQVEVMNKAILGGIKVRTTPRGNTQETPFSLVYGTEAVIPPELTVSTQRVINFDPAQNEEAFRENLNLIEEIREMAHIRQAENKRQMAKYYNKKVRPITFKVGDHVWRKNEASRREDLGKLGPYKVKEEKGNGSYILTKLDGYPVPRT